MNNNAVHYRKKCPPAHYRASRNSGRLRARFCALALLLVFSICTQEFVAPLRAFAAEDAGVTDSGSKDSGTFFDQFFTDISLKVGDKSYNLLQNKKEREVSELPSMEIGSKVSVKYQFEIDKDHIDPALRQDAKGKKLFEAIESSADVGEEVSSAWVTAGEDYDFTMPKLFRDAVVEADNAIELKYNKDTLGEVSVDTGEDTALITFFDEAFNEKSGISGWFQVEGTLTADGEGGDQPDKIILKFAEGIEVVIPLKTGESTYDIKKSWLKSYVDAAGDEADRRADKGSLVYEWQSEITVYPGAGLNPCIPAGLKLVDQYVKYKNDTNMLDISGEMGTVEKSDVKVEKGTLSKKETVSEEDYEVIDSTEAGFTLRFTNQVNLGTDEKVWVTYQTKTAKNFQDTINEVVAESGLNTQNKSIMLKNEVTLWPSDDKEGPSSEAERSLNKVNMLEKTSAKPAPIPAKNFYDYSVFVNWSTYNSFMSGSNLSEGSYVGIPMNSNGQLDIEEVLPSGTELHGFVFQDGTVKDTVYIDKTARNSSNGTNNVYALMKDKQSDNSRYEVKIIQKTGEKPVLRIQALKTGDNYIDQIIPFNIRVKATDPNDPAIKDGVTNKVQFVLDETTYESQYKVNGNTGVSALTKTGSFDWKTMQIKWTITANNLSGEGLTLVDTLGEGSTAVDIQTYLDHSLTITQDGVAVSAESFDVSVDEKTIKIIPKDGLNFGDSKKYVITFSTKIDPKDIGAVAVNGDKVYQHNTVKLMNGENILQSAKGDAIISKMGFSKNGGFIDDSKTATQWNIDINTGFSGRKNMVVYDQLKFMKGNSVDTTQDWSLIFRPTAVRIFAVGSEDWKEGAGSPAELLKGKESVYTKNISAAEWKEIVNKTRTGNDNTTSTGELISLWKTKTAWADIIPGISMLVFDLKNLPSDVLEKITQDGDKTTFNKFIRVQYDFACVEDNGKAKLAQYLTRSGANGIRNRAVGYVDNWQEQFNSEVLYFGTYEQPLTKEGAITSGSTSNVTWTVNLNKKNSQTIPLPEDAAKIDMTFKDTFGSPNLMLDDESIKVYRVTADGTDDGKTDGVNKFTPSMLTKEYTDENCLSFTLNLADMAKGDRNETGNWNAWYRIQYETFYYSDGSTSDSISVTNDASWSVIESGGTGGQTSAKVSGIKVQGGISLDKVGAIKVIKTDKETDRLLKGALFTLYEVGSDGKKGAPKASALTNANGIATFTGLQINSQYWLEETTPPLYYGKADDVKVVVSQSMKDGPVEVSVEDTRIADAGLTVTKVEAGSSKALQGAVFALQLTDSSEKDRFFKPDGTEVKSLKEAEATTNVDGKLVYTKLPHGIYSLIEVEAPKGYTIAKPTEGIVLNGETTSVTVEDAKIVPKTGGFQFTKVDAEGNLLAGAEFTLSKNGSVVATETSKSGQVIFKNILPGIYVLTETKAPEGYEKADGEISVIIKEENNDGEIAPDSKFPDGYAVKDGKLTVTNTPRYGSLRIWKTSDAETVAALEGAEFALSGLEENKEISLKATSNASGELMFTKLPLGTYTLTEVTAPAGYQPLTVPITVNVTKDEVAVTGMDSEKAAIVIRDNLQWLQIKNTAEPQFANLRIWKTSDAEQAAPLAGAVFELNGLEENKEVSLKATSTASGELEFTKLPLGKYTLTELTAPTGYQPLTAPVTVTISKDGITVAGVDSGTAAVVNRDGLQWLQVKNTAELQLADFRVWKTSDAENTAALEGAVFGLTGLEENKEVSLRATSGTSGELVFSKLPFGRYTLRELTAPAGYQLLTAPIAVTLSKDDGMTVSGLGSDKIAVVERDGAKWLQVKNTPEKPQLVSLRIWKTNSVQNASPLAGAEFMLTGLDGNAAIELKATSNASGELEFTNLPLGGYTLKELNAPSGYRLLSSPITVTISKENIALSGVDANMVTVVDRGGIQWLQVKNNKKSSGGGGSTDRPSNNDDDDDSTPPTDTVIIPVAPEEPELSEIPDNEVPLGDATVLIDEEPALPPEPIEISDEDVPLAGLPFVPKTGDSAARPIGLAALSALSLALIKVLRKRES